MVSPRVLPNPNLFVAMYVRHEAVLSSQIEGTQSTLDVPGHIGTPSPGHGYEAGDPYADFLPPPIVLPSDDQGDKLRAVVIVRVGTPRDGQRYVDPLLVLTGEEYERSTFDELHTRICDALRGPRPAVVMEAWAADGSVRLMMRDGSSRVLSAEEVEKSRASLFSGSSRVTWPEASRSSGQATSGVGRS